jgi:hypothetical protein
MNKNHAKPESWIHRSSTPALLTCELLGISEDSDFWIRWSDQATGSSPRFEDGPGLGFVLYLKFESNTWLIRILQHTNKIEKRNDREINTTK